MSDKKYCVYKLVCPEGKMYIGMTSDIKHRWRGNGIGYKGSTCIYEAIQKHGWDNFTKEVLMCNLTKEAAQKWEEALVKTYNTTDQRYGYNLQGGGKNPTIHADSIKRLSNSLKGHSISKKTREILKRTSEANAKAIICLDTKEIFKNSEEAGKTMGLGCTGIRKVCRGVQNACGGWHFAYLEDYKNGTAPVFKPKERKFNKVVCMTTGKVYDNVCEASRDTGINRRGIAYCCDGKYKQFKGHVWKYLKDVASCSNCAFYVSEPESQLFQKCLKDKEDMTRPPSYWCEDWKMKK